MNTDAPSAGPQVQILIAEDSPTQAQRLRHILEQRGHQVRHAANGRLALEEAQRHKPTLIISDVVMPEMDGYELCRRVKADACLGDIPVILVTTLSDPGDVIRGLECRADNFILKPYDEQYLLARVEFVLLNREVLNTERAVMGVEIVFNGQRHFITADRLQILNLLLSTYDAAIQRTKELNHAKNELLDFNRMLATANLQLEKEIREREKAQQALRDSEVRLRNIADNISAFVAEMSPDGLLTEVNRAMLNVSGLQREDLIGKPLVATRLFSYSPAVQAQIHDDIERAQRGENARHDVVACIANGAFRPFDLTIASVQESGGRVVKLILSAVDVAERKNYEESLHRAHGELARVNADLEKASRLKDEFLASMSHELRTPLNAILGLSEALLETAPGTFTERQVKSITTISTSGQHLLALINDILDLSKIEAGRLELHPEQVKVEPFCESCLAFVRTQAMLKRIDVALAFDGHVQTITADAKRLKQILVNLLTNAVKFTPEGGRIGLTIAAVDEGGLVRFTVWDTGIGIAAVDVPKLFRAFTQIDSRLSRAQEGTGLGLSLVAKLVNLHGGSVTLESEPGKGSRFTVTLPEIAQAASAPPFAKRDETDRRAYRRALIIEDDATASGLLADYLSELGLGSVLHGRGKDSVEAAFRERPDIILLDIQLPDESGWNVLTALKQNPGTRDIPVVVVSVVDEPGRSLALGAAEHFTKPITRQQLAAFLQRNPFVPVGSASPFVALPSLTGPAILLAEDNESNIQTIGGYLEEKGYAMHYARNGALAVTLARALHPALILMDIQMPVMDGLTAIREIRTDAKLANVPIVALTALAMPGDRERCLAAGATDYMSKPVSMKALMALLKRVLPEAIQGKA